MFQKATKKQSRLRLALIGPSGSGKTYSALSIAQGLGEKIAVIDTERGSASKYSDTFQFDVLEPETFAPDVYVSAIQAADAEGYDVLIIDSLSHAWCGKGGALEMVDDAARRSKSGNTFAAWRDVTPQHNRLVDAILQSSCHIIVTMRSKTEYIMEDNGKGKMTPKKVGLQPIQRDGLEYEFDVVCDVDLDHYLTVSKTRCAHLDRAVIDRPGAALGQTLKAWLTDGAPMPEPKAQPMSSDARLALYRRIGAAAAMLGYTKEQTAAACYENCMKDSATALTDDELVSFVELMENRVAEMSEDESNV